MLGRRVPIRALPPSGLHQSIHLAQPWVQDMGRPHVFGTKGGCSIAVVQPLTAREFKSQTTMTCHDFWQVAQLCASAVMRDTTYYPFLTGRLGGLTVKQHV